MKMKIHTWVDGICVAAKSNRTSFGGTKQELSNSVGTKLTIREDVEDFLMKSSKLVPRQDGPINVELSAFEDATGFGAG